VEPRLEPADNLIENFVIPHIHTSNTVIINIFEGSVIHVTMDSSASGSQFAYFINKNSFKNLNFKKLTLSFKLKVIEGDIVCYLGHGMIGSNDKVTYKNNAEKISLDSNKFEKRVSVDTIELPELKGVWLYAVIRSKHKGITKILLKELSVISGVYPMGG
jgi:hypothetical protein